MSAEEIATPSAANRRVAWPYIKLTVANPKVNQKAAVLLTSLGRARLETLTVLYGRDGAPSHGVVVARNEAGARLIARLAPDQADALA